MTSNDPQDTSRPSSQMAIWLGYAGLIPFVISAAAVLLFDEDPFLQETAGQALVAYGAVILSFLGGVRWGRALGASSKETQTRDFVLSVLPSIFGWSCLLLPIISGGIFLLIFGYLWQLYVDLKATRNHSLPRWFGRLRLRLTVGAIIALVAGGLGLL
uniref:DUF3429 domain-containing protein n=1 Tax=Pararhizobium sp. IMCC3301 TaxID=3067904 RepID=UPI002740DF42|nr:DUF3429 domain-containing protein [Pararhizobium sp. IMCC3301]